MNIKFSPSLLFAYANRIGRAAEKKGATIVYPSFAKCAEHFNVPLEEIEAACDEGVPDGYLGSVVALQTGGGIGCIEEKSDYLVEAYHAK